VRWLLAFLLVLPVPPSAEEEDLRFLLFARPVRPSEITSPSLSDRTSELKMALMGLIRLYQRFISSQDIPSCNFTLSCSRFAMEALSRYGPLHGVLMASDRLMRCYGLGRRYYPIDPGTGLAVDRPPEAYYLGEER